MTNFGFHARDGAAGIEVATTAVGDRYVLDELRERGWALGGEQSGHIIDLGFGPSGDGIASALLTLEALGGRDLRERGADGEAAAEARERPRARPRGARRCAAPCTTAVEREHGRARRPRPRAGAPVGHRAAGPRDGRGADAEETRRRLRRALVAAVDRERRSLAGSSAARLVCAASSATSGARPAQEILLAGLRKLEYRGYDCAGIVGPADGDDRRPCARSATSTRSSAALAGSATATARRRPPGDDRHRPHALGHPRRGPRRTRIRTTTRRARPRRGQRHRRELHRAASERLLADGASLHLARPTPRSSRT